MMSSLFALTEIFDRPAAAAAKRRARKKAGFAVRGLVVGGLLLGAAACTTATTPPANTAESIIESALSSSVQLFTEREDGRRRTGSGVVFALAGERSYIVTTAHLLEPQVPQKVFVALPGQTERTEAQVLTINAEKDIALLETTPLRVKPVHFQEDARLGENIWVVSFPWGRRVTVVNGFVSQIAQENDNPASITRGPISLIDATVSYGTSGGGVFNGKTGNLLGIVRGYRTAKLSVPGGNGQSLSVPIAGETTVIPISDIRCQLEEAQLAHLTPIDDWASLDDGGFGCPKVTASRSGATKTN
ncbi:S1 family peptidase [Denitrobaculum tricleocarpae]|uniref:Trypsin-like peptidase domain-containing protein n=1 Tax=Denitrobaculum tricleocarpae TaxID=2591009 RepID=A0A545TTI4_9PROT|nr:serine protease [Denitrobaculum tricleocarpae]TQV80461.1 trypsin-like peptidase domain-containing protein [Denitrobaculum tricleocarpae]